MAKDYFDEITPSPAPTQRSIRDIPPSPRAATHRPPAPPRPGAPMPPHRRAHRSGRLLIWVLAIASLALLGVIGYIMTRGTSIDVVPRSHTIVFDETATYSAYPVDSESAAEGSLRYRLLTKELTDSAPVEATGTETVREAASGTITVYNNYSAAAVRLITNTRFETPDGLVFRVHKPIVVPGKTSSGPGSIDVTVYADAAGEQYNIGPVVKFTLPALKTSSPDMYTTVYAKSTGAMTGGFVGTKPKVSQATLDAAQAQMQARLSAQAKDAFGDDPMVYQFPELMQVSFEAMPATIADDGTTQAHLRARISVPAFERTLFDSYIAIANSAALDSGSASIIDPSTFTITPISSGEAEYGVTPIDFNLSGKAQFVWNVDTQALASDLAGRNRQAFEAVIKGHTGIESAKAHLSPFWRRTFPADPSDIVVNVQIPQ